MERHAAFNSAGRQFYPPTGLTDDFLTEQQDKFGNSLWSVENQEFEEAGKWGSGDLLWQDGKYDWVRDNTTDPMPLKMTLRKNGKLVDNT